MTARPQMRLTEDDVTAGVSALFLFGPKDIKNAERIVFEIVKAINAQRGGDPLGTIRRCDYGNGTSAVAVRVCGEDGAHFWKVTHPSGKVDELDGDLANWKLVVTP
jgi:hypothetical protein